MLVVPVFEAVDPSRDCDSTQSLAMEYDGGVEQQQVPHRSLGPVKGGCNPRGVSIFPTNNAQDGERYPKLRSRN